MYIFAKITKNAISTRGVKNYLARKHHFFQYKPQIIIKKVIFEEVTNFFNYA